MMLVKKFMIYKLMGSDFFINYSLGMMTTCYRVMGIPVTNKAINTSVGTLFTSGETLATLMADIEIFKEKNIASMANYAVEGLPTMNEEKVKQIYAFMLESIEMLTNNGQPGNFALKLTGLISIDILTRMNTA